jgi:SAM-dependent methyltransferase
MRCNLAGSVGHNGFMTAMPRSHGSGPGAITPDGCAVDFYALMPDLGEPAIVHEAAGAGASILELGCGAGRVTHPLIALGHPVVAVDESPEMLTHVRGAETVCARIQDLSLGRRFGAVLLASHLINADGQTRAAFLDVCRRHVADDGCVIIQQHGPAWFLTAKDSEMTRDGVLFRMRDVSRPAPNLVSATVEYVVGDRCWTQTFTTERLDEAGLGSALGAAGLRLDRYLTEDRSWLRAVPAPAAGSASGR